MCEEEIQVRDSAEYPPVKVCEKNPRYAMAMLSNIGACNSEMSAVSLYFYNSMKKSERHFTRSVWWKCTT